jgi:hypothetical protein
MSPSHLANEWDGLEAGIFGKLINGETDGHRLTTIADCIEW